MNEFRFGFNRMKGSTTQHHPFTFSRIGATVPSFDDASPLFTIAGASLGGNVGSDVAAFNTFVTQDTVSYTFGRHFARFGGGLTRVQDNQPVLSFYGAALFLRFSDFLLGQNAAQIGTAYVCAFVGCGSGYSDIAYAQDFPGNVVRAYRILSDHLYAQDDIRVSPRLTVNVGLRYERLGDLADKLGHNTSFYPQLANHTPPASGTLQGYVGPANYLRQRACRGYAAFE